MPPITRIENESKAMEFKGFRFYAIEISGIPSHPVHGFSKELKAKMRFQFWVSFFDTKQKTFFGKTWKSSKFEVATASEDYKDPFTSYSFEDSEGLTVRNND